MITLYYILCILSLGNNTGLLHVKNMKRKKERMDGNIVAMTTGFMADLKNASVQSFHGNKVSLINALLPLSDLGCEVLCQFFSIHGH